MRYTAPAVLSSVGIIFGSLNLQIVSIGGITSVLLGRGMGCGIAHGLAQAALLSGLLKAGSPSIMVRMTTTAIVLVLSCLISKTPRLSLPGAKYLLWNQRSLTS